MAGTDTLSETSLAFQAIKDDYSTFAREAKDNTGRFLAHLSQEFEKRMDDFHEAEVKRAHSQISKMQADALAQCKNVREEIERERKLVQNERAAWEQEKQEMSKLCDLPERIKLDVGGYHYTTSLDTLCKDKKSLLGMMFSGRYPVQTAEGRTFNTDARTLGAVVNPRRAFNSVSKSHGINGYFIDRNGEYFSYILDYLRTGSVILPPEHHDAILKESEFYHLDLRPPQMGSYIAHKNTVRPESNGMAYQYTWEGDQSSQLPPQSSQLPPQNSVPDFAQPLSIHNNTSLSTAPNATPIVHSVQSPSTASRPDQLIVSRNRGQSPMQMPPRFREKKKGWKSRNIFSFVQTPRSTPLAQTGTSNPALDGRWEHLMSSKHNLISQNGLTVICDSSTSSSTSVTDK
eukprot:gene18077-808_t